MANDRLVEHAAALTTGDEASSSSSQSDVMPAYGVLRLTTEQFLLETERLLSSLETDHDNYASSSKTTITDQEADSSGAQEKITTRNTTGDRKQEIRNLQAAKRRHKYQQKLKHEKQTLLEQKGELQAQLGQLLAEQAQDKSSVTKALTMSVWRALAKHQLEKRLEAEQLQRELRAAVVHRARYIDHIDTLLRPPLCVKPDDKNARVEGAAVLRNFLLEMDSLYQQTDKFLSDATFHVSTSITYKPTRKVEHGVEFFEYAESIAMPFPFEKVADAMTQIMLSDDYNVMRFDEGINEPKNTTAGSYQLKSRCDSGEEVDFVVNAAVRKYQEARLPG